jgi:hypothetical protein
MASISYHGALFDDSEAVTPAITKAANVAKTFGLGLIKARTPVDTHKLKSAWSAKLEGNGIRFDNPTPYAGFVEHGTRKMAPRNMLGDSLSDIAEVFLSELSAEIGKALASEILETSGNINYRNSVQASDKYKRTNPDTRVGSKIKPTSKTGLSKKKFSKDYLFANRNDILSKGQKTTVNAGKPKWQKGNHVAKPPYKV